MAILTSPARSVRPVHPAPETPSWQGEIRSAIRSAGELCRQLGLSAELAEHATTGAAEFPVFVPLSYLRRIEPGNPNDPLLLQVMPRMDEGKQAEGFTIDPVGDVSAALHPGVLQKYEGRALLIATGSCAVHCRYCFRRHFPYQESPHNEKDWSEALKIIAGDNSIKEVILSGGDPLMLVDSRLDKLIGQIAQLNHVERLRIHTRLPIMIPQRVTSELVKILTTVRLSSVMVIHVNHARELADDLADALNRLRRAGVMLLNQAVLLRCVNDSVVVQRELCERLIALGVLPYYLHQLDRVAGAAHFEVPIAEGQQIMRQLRQQLPGYLVPRYVQEIAGMPHKVPLESDSNPLAEAHGLLAPVNHRPGADG